MKIYIAGPDVFRPDVAQWASEVRTLCVAHGHHALIPLEGGETTAQGIFRNNLQLIGEADAVLANLNPFRGVEPDSGTCVEIGYALALGKPVIGYLENIEPMCSRFQAQGPDSAGCYRDAAGWAVENFGLPLNLMLAVPVRLVTGGLSDCLAILGKLDR
jgi:nucleoside 2-deoxyribosyltransferase